MYITNCKKIWPLLQLNIFHALPLIYVRNRQISKQLSEQKPSTKFLNQVKFFSLVLPLSFIKVKKNCLGSTAFFSARWTQSGQHHAITSVCVPALEFLLCSESTAFLLPLKNFQFLHCNSEMVQLSHSYACNERNTSNVYRHIQPPLQQFHVPLCVPISFQDMKWHNLTQFIYSIHLHTNTPVSNCPLLSFQPSLPPQSVDITDAAYLPTHFTTTIP